MDGTLCEFVMEFLSGVQSIHYPSYPLLSSFTNWFNRIATPALDISTEIRDGHNMQYDKGAVIVPNHQSALDAIGKNSLYIF